jgi:hypothetical protein
MNYLELKDLIIGEAYICIPYFDRSKNMKLKYVGKGKFEAINKELFSIYGDIRYVTEQVKVR